jgi:putative membrane protein
MQHRVREHVPATTGLLTAVSLALVFGAALGAIPGTALPPAIVPIARALTIALA